jgi:hypothetical protein
MACGWVRIHRFSPMFELPDKFGIRHMRPLKTYRYIYPFDESVLSNIAYNFEFDFDGMEKMDRLSAPLRQEVENWQRYHEQFRLEVINRAPHRIVVQDTRAHRVFPTYIFDNPEKEIIEFCDQPRSLDSIMDFLRTTLNGKAPSEKWLRGFLGYLVKHRLMLCLDDRYLNLILLNPVPAAEPITKDRLTM